jgi:hypothetical protein
VRPQRSPAHQLEVSRSLRCISQPQALRLAKRAPPRGSTSSVAIPPRTGHWNQRSLPARPALDMDQIDMRPPLAVHSQQDIEASAVNVRKGHLAIDRRFRLHHTAERPGPQHQRVAGFQGWTSPPAFRKYPDASAGWDLTLTRRRFQSTAGVAGVVEITA